MNANKVIEVTYISEKVQKSPIITIEENISIVDSQSELIDIKNSVMGILDCTNIKEKIEENSEGRHIYKLREDISKHILGTISNKYSKEEKRELIKNELNKITQNESVVLIHSNHIFITDTGREKRKFNNKNVKNIDKRFNGYIGDEIDTLIDEYLGDGLNIKTYIKDIVNNINYNGLNLEQIISLITTGYKRSLLNEVSKKLNNDFDLDNEILNAISGKILRDNFSYTKILLFENIYIKLISKKINETNIEEVLSNNILDKYFDFNKNNIFLNIENIEKLYTIETKQYINKLINKFFIFDGKIDNTLLEISKSKIGINFTSTIKENIIKKVVEKLLIIFEENPSKLPNSTIDFLKKLSLNNSQIKVSYIKTPIDIIKLSSNLKLLINQELKLEKLISNKEKIIFELEKSISNTSNGIQLNESRLKSNKIEINKQLDKIGFKSLLNTDLIISSLLDESKNISDKQIIAGTKLKNLSSNKIKETLNNSKIKKIKLYIDKLKSRVRSIEKIIKLINDNKLLTIQIQRYNDTIKKINTTFSSINISKNELNIIVDKINQIKMGLKTMLINTIN